MKAIFLFSTVLWQVALFSQTTTGSFMHGGQTRTYRVHLPPGFNPSSSRPLVLNLHGLGSNGQQQELYTGFNNVADTANIVVVYPNALNGTSGIPEWNAYGLGSTDDVGFLSALIDSMQSQYNIDMSRVYCIGMSNGGYMSYRMACERSCRIAAIASVTGLLVENIFTPCNISRPVPLMQIHGTADGTVAYSGVAATISSWRAKNGCPSTPTTTNLPDINTSDNSTVTVDHYGPCNNGSEVILYTVNNGGHTWPGSSIPLGPTTNQDFNASSTIWNFLRKYSMAAYISPATASVCAGSSATLAASGGTGYSWSTGGTGSSISVSPTSNTAYNVTINFGGACSATGSRTVTVTSGLTASISPVGAICAGESATLTASGGTNYSWSNGQTTASITVTPASNTTYTVTATDAGGGCSATASRLVSVNPIPSVTVSGLTDVCAGMSTTLTASGGLNYLWSNNSTNASITVSPTSSTNYTVTATDANGCTASESTVVTVNPNPTASISPATVSICSGSATLTASGGTGYAWNTGATTASVTVSPTATATYSVTISDANGCTATTSRTVTVSGALTASITMTADSICPGESATLTASGGLNYSWSNGSTSAAIPVSPAATTSFSVTVSDGGSCSDTASATVTVKPLPAANAVANPSSITPGGSSMLTASGGDSYSWSNGLAAAVMTVSPSITTTYSVTVSLDGCIDSAQVTVTVGTTGIDEQALSSFNIYPNPASGYLNIEYLNERPTTVEIYSVDGKKVHVSERDAVLTDNIIQISLKKLKLDSGLYMVCLKTSDGIVTKKPVFIE